jgi:hypothetical protein
VIVRPQPRQAIVAPARGKRRRVKCVDRRPIGGTEAEMGTGNRPPYIDFARDRKFDAEGTRRCPVVRSAIGSEIGDAYDAKGTQGRIVETATAVDVGNAKRRMIQHDTPSGQIVFLHNHPNHYTSLPSRERTSLPLEHRYDVGLRGHQGGERLARPPALDPGMPLFCANLPFLLIRPGSAATMLRTSDRPNQHVALDTLPAPATAARRVERRWSAWCRVLLPAATREPADAFNELQRLSGSALSETSAVTGGTASADRALRQRM